jgi:hypothetical protein
VPVEAGERAPRRSVGSAREHQDEGDLRVHWSVPLP